MNFISPNNYNFNTKLLGFLDYPTIFFNIIWFLFVFFITKLFIKSILIKIIFIIFFYFPVLLISLFGFNQENIFYILKYLFLFYKRPKIYLYTNTDF